MTQLALELEPPRPNPNAHFFNEDGSPRRLMWCSDSVRIAWRKGVEVGCPYTDPRPSLADPGTVLPPIGLRHRPAGGCCKDIEPIGSRGVVVDFYRADGNMVCAGCGLTYWRHPVEEFAGMPDNPLVLHRLCNGDLVKT